MVTACNNVIHNAKFSHVTQDPRRNNEMMFRTTFSFNWFHRNNDRKQLWFHGAHDRLQR